MVEMFNDRYIRVSYQGLIVDIVPEHLEQAQDILRSESKSGKKRILESVQRSLDEALKLTQSNPTAISPAMMQDIANDICIWFANEVLEGRADNYKQMVQ